jgi:NAD(P)-dependent dehydrogenase (short-subunit alcohol dehydrogenase family)
MQIEHSTFVISGGASGLGLATAERLVAAGANVALIDLPTSDGAAHADRLGARARFLAADVTQPDQVAAALAKVNAQAPIRGIVHTAGRGARIRLVSKNGEPGDFAEFEQVIRLNILGSYNLLRLGAAQMVKHQPVEGERGVIVLTASVAAYEGQIGQVAYAAAKAGVVGMTITSARDLASSAIRVCTIAPGIFDTPLVNNVLRPDIRADLEGAVPFPKRMGQAPEYAALAQHILENAYLNGETIRLDGAIRMAPR